METPELLRLIADAVSTVDASRVPFKAFQPGVGPYGEPQLVRLIANFINEKRPDGPQAVTKRVPDLLLPGEWALEFKLARPFGDNGKQAENWSVNLLHPYEGNVSAIGDCYKLSSLKIAERKAVVVIGYEHTSAMIDLEPLFKGFEVLADLVNGFRLGPRSQIACDSLIHPVHQRARIAIWEVFGRKA
jgi:hypothetical protein